MRPFLQFYSRTFATYEQRVAESAFGRDGQRLSLAAVSPFFKGAAAGRLYLNISQHSEAIQLGSLLAGQMW